MITPVFFPFTHVSPYQMETVLTVFKTVSFFPVMSESELKPGFNPAESIPGVIPVIKDINSMAPVIRKADEYLQWAAMNRGNENNLKILLRKDPYFISDTGIFALKSQVMTHASAAGSRTENPAPGSESLFKAMLFLRMAQVLDQEKQMIRAQFDSLKQTGNSILETLRGDEENTDLSSTDDRSGHGDEDEPGNYLTDQRVQAWFTFWRGNRHSELFQPRPVFVTTSEAAFDYLVSFDEKNINALDIDNIKVHENNCAEKNIWQDGFCRFVQDALEKGSGRSDRITGADDGCTKNVRIRLYLLSKEEAVNNILDGTHETLPVCLVQLK